MCLKPRYIKSKDQVFPCGICPKCKYRRIAQWVFRLLEEEKISSSAYFVTLTYDDHHLSHERGTVTPFGHLSLSLRDLQLYFKRQRKLQAAAGNDQTIRYYACGEYGGHTARPHFHYIGFNVDAELIEKAWGMGNIKIKPAHQETMAYTMKYICKNRRRFEAYDGRMPEFSVMSKGLGISYLDATMYDWHTDDVLNRMYVTLKGGVKVSMPRYYRDRIYYEFEKLALAEVYAIQKRDAELEKLEKATVKSTWNEQQAIEAAFERMYHSTKKCKL